LYNGKKKTLGCLKKGWGGKRGGPPWAPPPPPPFINTAASLLRSLYSGPSKSLLELSGGWGTSRKVGWECAAHFPKPLPHLWPKSAFFCFFIYYLCKNLIAHTSIWPLQPADSVFPNISYVGLLLTFLSRRWKGSFFEETYPIQDYGAKIIPYYNQNGQNRYPTYYQNSWRNHTLWGRTYLYSPYKGVSPRVLWPVVRMGRRLNLCTISSSLTSFVFHCRSDWGSVHRTSESLKSADSALLCHS